MHFMLFNSPQNLHYVFHLINNKTAPEKFKCYSKVTIIRDSMHYLKLVSLTTV